jgi:hypothetical protein
MEVLGDGFDGLPFITRDNNEINTSLQNGPNGPWHIVLQLIFDANCTDRLKVYLYFIEQPSQLQGFSSLFFFRDCLITFYSFNIIYPLQCLICIYFSASHHKCSITLKGKAIQSIHNILTFSTLFVVKSLANLIVCALTHNIYFWLFINLIFFIFFIYNYFPTIDHRLTLSITSKFN